MVYLYSTFTGFERYVVLGSLGARKRTQEQFVWGGDVEIVYVWPR
jgi:hypothetical protein